MLTRRILLFLPIVLLAALLQSALWVPSFANQTSGNPERLTTFIEAKIGDAKLLNPVVSADASSSEVERRVFEGLLDVDEHLEIKGRLAERFELSELAYVAAIPERKLPNGNPATATALLDTLRAGFAAGKLPEIAALVRSISEVAPSEREFTEEVIHTSPKGKPEPYEIKGRVSLPARVELQLSRVTPKLFERLSELLGADYFKNYPFAER